MAGNKRRTLIKGGTFKVTENPTLVANVRKLKDEDPANVRLEEKPDAE